MLTIICSVITTLGTFVVGYILYKIQQRDKQREIEDEKKRLEDLDAFARAQQREALQEQYRQLTTRMLRALARDRLAQSTKFFIKKGSVPEDERESILELAEEYFEYGGNGKIHQRIEQFKELPVTMSE